MIISSTIQAVKDVPVMDVIGQYVKLRKRGANYIGLCPFHDERTPSFAVHPAKNMFKCFGCGTGGNALRFVMDYEKKTFFEAVELIAGISGIAIETEQRTKRTRWTQAKPNKKAFKPAPFDTIPLTLLDSRTPDVSANSLTRQMAAIGGEDVVKDILQEYKISIEADGFINYPQIDKDGRYRTGKSIQYKDGHRTGYFKWTHDELKKKNILPANFNQKQCFTGEHLVSSNPVAIVEGQSTMLFMAALAKAASKYNVSRLKNFAGFTWIATGGSDGIGWKDEQVMQALKSKDVVLFPDAGFYDQWFNDAELMQEHGVKVQVLQLIESKYNAGQLKYNEDLRDYFMVFSNDIKDLCKPVTAPPTNLLNIHSKDVLIAPITTYLAKNLIQQHSFI
jgi:hypothetical protein